jgi:hypothetical protein
MPSPPAEKAFEDTELYHDLSCGVPELMAGLQKVLIELGYEFFHPNPLQLVARCQEVYLIVSAEYESENRVAVSVKIPLEGKHDFAVMNAIERLVDDLKKGSLNRL